LEDDGFSNFFRSTHDSILSVFQQHCKYITFLMFCQVEVFENS
jgi:hypothetical protein